MLKRRKRIQKYIAALKIKKQNLKKEVEKLKLQQNEGSEGEADQRMEAMRGGMSLPKLTFESIDQQEQKAVWEDSDEQLLLPKKNMFRKLQLNENVSQQQYEQRLRRFYRQKYGMRNWAVEGQGEEERDLQDMLNEEDIYAQGRKNNRTKVEFIGKTGECHGSIVTGIDCRGSVFASVGYDQKVKLWSLNASESNPELRIKLEKDVYTQKYPLTGCIFRGNELVLSTQRQNYLLLDCNKFKLKHVSSSFLNDHSTFQNIRLSQEKSQLLIFSNNKISLLDQKNIYQGSLLAGQPLTDVQFGKNHSIFGVSNDYLFQWDARMWRLINARRDCLAYTKLWTMGDQMAIGSKLGVVRLSTLSEGIQEYAQINNLVTHVTDLKANTASTLLAQSSKWKGNAIRLIDLPKGRCIPGWPTVSTKFGLATTITLSSGDELSVGNSHGYLGFYSIRQE